MLGELGLPILVAGSSEERFGIELLAGDLPAAEAVLREACTTLEQVGEKGFLSTRAACLGLCLALQDRPAEAESFLAMAEGLIGNGGDDVLNLVNLARAAISLARGSLGEAEEHARVALAAIAHWDHSNIKGDSLVQLGDVLQAAGRADEAVAAYSEALALYQQKENLVAVGRVGRSLAALQG